MLARAKGSKLTAETRSRCRRRRIRFGKPWDVAFGFSSRHDHAPVLASGATIQRTMDAKLPAAAAGTYRLFVSLDEEHASGDANFGDNVKASGAFSLIDMIPPKRRAATH